MGASLGSAPLSERMLSTATTLLCAGHTEGTVPTPDGGWIRRRTESAMLRSSFRKVASFWATRFRPFSAPLLGNLLGKVPARIGDYLVSGTLYCSCSLSNNAGLQEQPPTVWARS